MSMVELTMAAQRLGISWERARRAVLTGSLEGVKEDGRWYVTVESVREYERRPETSKARPETRQ